MRSAFALLLATMASLPAFAEMYKWVDSAGQVHYSQTRPPSGRYEVVGHAPPPGAAPNQDALNQQLQKSQQEAPKLKDEADKVAQAKADRLERCKSAMNNLAYLDAQTARRLSTTDAKGNASRMTDEEFQKARAAEQQRIKESCD